MPNTVICQFRVIPGKEEIFCWQDGAVERAHEHPDVMAIWEPMDQLCERRGDKPNMEFPHVDTLNV